MGLDGFVTISVRKETREKLQNMGTKKDTYDDIVNRLIKKVEKYEGEDV